MHKFLFVLFFLVFIHSPILSTDVQEPISMNEIWGYLMSGEENNLKQDMPITDIGYFAAGMNFDGTLKGVPDASKLQLFKKRIHLVIAETSNYALTHFMLNSNLPYRGHLLDEIKNKAELFDGVQIDFEAVRSEDKDYFFAFLVDLKKKIGPKILSVALPARKNQINDSYNYKTISNIADRIIIMGYDQHWSGGNPGPIASNIWCKEISDYAITQIEKDKIIMGIPFYGRSWINKSLSRAYKYSGIMEIYNEYGLTPERTSDGIPYFKFPATVEVSLFFEDNESILTKLNIYKENSIHKVAFWRIGLENSDVWQYIKTK